MFPGSLKELSRTSLGHWFLPRYFWKLDLPRNGHCRTHSSREVTDQSTLHKLQNKIILWVYAPPAPQCYYSEYLHLTGFNESITTIIYFQSLHFLNYATTDFATSSWCSALAVFIWVTPRALSGARLPPALRAPRCSHCLCPTCKLGPGKPRCEMWPCCCPLGMIWQEPGLCPKRQSRKGRAFSFLFFI